MILAIDPGSVQSGFVLFDGSKVHDSGVWKNHDVLDLITVGFASEGPPADVLAIEMIASYGMAVGAEVFETCRWAGRFQQQWRDPDAVMIVYRKAVKLHLCGTPRAKDANIRAALVDALGPKGTKKAPGPCYGIKNDAWAALAVAVYASSTL